LPALFPPIPCPWEKKVSRPQRHSTAGREPAKYLLSLTCGPRFLPWFPRLTFPVTFSAFSPCRKRSSKIIHPPPAAGPTSHLRNRPGGVPTWGPKVGVTEPVPSHQDEAKRFRCTVGPHTRSSQSHTPVALFFVIISFLFLLITVDFFSSSLSLSQRSTTSLAAPGLPLSLLSREWLCRRAQEGGREERKRGARVLRRRLLPPSGERHSRRSGRASFAPPPSRSVPIGAVGSAVPRASVTVWVRCSVDSGFSVLHLSAFAACSFKASFF